MDESDYLVNRTIGFKKSVRADIDRGESCIIYSSSYQSQFVVGNLSGAYARRISIQHRLVYQVYEDVKTVKIVSMWSHYEF